MNRTLKEVHLFSVLSYGPPIPTQNDQSEATREGLCKRLGRRDETLEVPRRVTNSSKSRNRRPKINFFSLPYDIPVTLSPVPQRRDEGGTTSEFGNEEI